ARANLAHVRGLVGAERTLFAVVKADGYGFGAEAMGRAFLEAGADALAVADGGEGVRLRDRGIAAPILVYPSGLPGALAELVARGLTPTVTDVEGARAVAAATTASQGGAFVKVDVGLERLGVPAESAVKLILAMLEIPRFRLAGVCAHPHAYADAADERGYVDWQLGRFTAVLDELAARGVDVPIRLLASTPLVLRYPHTYLNAVDPGRMLYGIALAGDGPRAVPLRPVLRALKSRLVEVKDIQPRERFAAQAPFPVPAPMRFGVIPLGVADGLVHLHAGRVLVRGRSAAVLASPSLEHTRIDLSRVPDARVGDEVVVIGRQGDAEITPAEVAARQGLAQHQLVPLVGPRVERFGLSA
ncbi:MAG: alanine racemase, partial [Candidatus Rokuibacteriota bacterium]